MPIETGSVSGRRGSPARVPPRLVRSGSHTAWAPLHDKTGAFESFQAGLPLHNANLFGMVEGPRIRLSAVHSKGRVVRVGLFAGVSNASCSMRWHEPMRDHRVVYLS